MPTLKAQSNKYNDQSLVFCNHNNRVGITIVAFATCDVEEHYLSDNERLLNANIETRYDFAYLTDK